MNDAAADIEGLGAEGAPPVEEPLDPMDTALQWVGFENESTRECLRREGFESFDDSKSMKEKDIRDHDESDGRRTVGDGRFIFGVRHIMYLMGMIHWVQDFARVSESASLVPSSTRRSLRPR